MDDARRTSDAVQQDLSAANLAASWAETGRHVARTVRRRATGAARDDFAFGLAQLDPGLLQAYVTDRVAAAMDGLAGALRTRTEDPENDPTWPESERTPSVRTEFPAEAFRPEDLDLDQLVPAEDLVEDLSGLRR